MTVFNCLFCDCSLPRHVKIEVEENPEEEQDKIPHLLNTFSKYFCLDFNIITQFDERPDKLPFCYKCETSLVNLSQLNCQLERLKLAISSTVTNLSREIIESTNKFVNADPDGNNSDSNGEEEEEEGRQGLLHFDMTNPQSVQRYRRVMYQILSPTVILSPVNPQATFQPPDNTNDNCNDFSNANHSHHEEEEEEDEEEEIPCKRYKTTTTTSNEEEEDSNPVKIEADASMKMNLDQFLQEWQQQNHDDEEQVKVQVVLKTEEDLNIQIHTVEDSSSGQDPVAMTEEGDEEEEEEEEEQNTNVIKNKVVYKCTICPQKQIAYSSRQVLNRHLRSHVFNGNVPRPFQCMYENCSMVFLSRVRLMQHEKTHEKGLIPCHICMSKFTSAMDFKIHAMEVHGGPKVFFCLAISCLHCTFFSKRALDEHVKKYHHSPVKTPFKCTFEKCSEAFALRSDFHKHLAVHML